jgi:uncharacterized protein (DUF362 family)
MKKISRRSFLRKAALLGGGTLLGDTVFWRLIGINPPGVLAETLKPDVVAVKGRDYFANTLRAVEPLGGIASFVSRGDRVGLLVNSPFKHFGASVNPDVTLAVIQMCLDAGAKEIYYLKNPHQNYWERSALAGKYAAAINSLKPESGDHVQRDIPGGILIKQAKVSKELLACDVFINLAKTKHHRGVHITGTLKNMMGLCFFSTNIRFHMGSLKRLSSIGDVERLSQCIADLNLVRKPDLCISDATEFLTENGPYGPGKLGRADIVAASLNRVSLDAFCCRFLGRHPKNILMIGNAYRHGLGEMDLDKLQIKTISL